MTAILPLPICGLISDAPAPDVAAQLRNLRQAADAVVTWQPPLLTFKALGGASLACKPGAARDGYGYYGWQHGRGPRIRPRRRMVRYWQRFEEPEPGPAVWTDSYAAPMPDGSRLRLPLRDMGETAVAGLIANQASFHVVDRLSQWMAEAVAAEAADVVVGLPTLGHVFGQGVARALGHTQWVAPGTTRKLWYVESLSVPTASITSPEAGRRMWLDPRLLDRLTGRRVLLVDDVISTGRSAMAGLALLSAAGVTPVAACVAMAQTDRWREQWPSDIQMHFAFSTPLFWRGEGGWQPEGRQTT